MTIFENLNSAYYKTGDCLIYQGNTLEVLRTLPDEFIDCVVTSPPYWALRDYQLEPQVWDGDEKCQHNFNLETKTGDMRFRPGYNSMVGNNKNPAIYPIKHKPGETNPGKEGWYKDKGGLSIVPSQGNFCSLCGAWKGSLGLEPTFELYLKHLLQIFDEIKRILKPTGTCWVNLGDSYFGGGRGSDTKLRGANKGNPTFESMEHAKPKWNNMEYPDKSLCLIPERFAIGMVEGGWILRNELIWHKHNCMPSSVKDRFTVDFEKIFFLTKSRKYFFEQQFEVSIDPESYSGRRPRNKDKKVLSGDPLLNHNIWKLTGKKYPNRNMRAVWQINTKPFKGAHFAVFPPELPERCIKAGCPKGGIVLDPFMGSGTTGLVAKKLGRKFIGVDLSQSYVDMAIKRIANTEKALI